MKDLRRRIDTEEKKKMTNREKLLDDPKRKQTTEREQMEKE